MILSESSIFLNNIVDPFHDRSTFRGMSYGVSPAGYDIRVDVDSLPIDHDYRRVMTPDGNGVLLEPNQSILLGAIETFNMPKGVVGFVRDKSTWARRGLVNAQGVLEPGWRGNLSLRLSNVTHDQEITIVHGEPIAQVVFLWMDAVPGNPYDGKYQDEERGPQGPRYDT